MNHSQTDFRSALDATNHAFMDAFRRRDGAAIAALYTENGQLLPPGCDAITGRAGIARYWQEAMKIGLRKLETTEVEVYGPIAHEVGRYAIETPDGNEAAAGMYIVVWKFESGAWKMHRDVWNSRATRSEQARGR
jgi:uncharacterized protein (TIGR02246 family)